MGGPWRVRACSTPCLTQALSSSFVMPQPLSEMQTSPLALAGVVPETTREISMQRGRGELCLVARSELSTNSASA